MRLKQLAEDEKLLPIVDRIFDFDNIVQAHEYVDTGRKVGSVAIQIAD